MALNRYELAVDESTDHLTAADEPIEQCTVRPHTLAETVVHAILEVTFITHTLKAYEPTIALDLPVSAAISQMLHDKLTFLQLIIVNYASDARLHVIVLVVLARVNAAVGNLHTLDQLERSIKEEVLLAQRRL